MAAQRGNAFLLKVEATPGGGTYNAVGGGRAVTLTINNEMVDVTNKDSSGFRELLAAAGINSMSISAEGVYVDDANFDLVATSAEANTHLNYQIVFPGSTANRTYTGSFGVESLEATGEYNGAITYSMTLQADGQVTIS